MVRGIHLIIQKIGGRNEYKITTENKVFTPYFIQ